jgi:hypothetical protein
MSCSVPLLNEGRTKGNNIAEIKYAQNNQTEENKKK